MTEPILFQIRQPLPIAPRGGAIGTEVSLEATGLPPQASLLIAFANLQSYQLMQRVLTDSEGSFKTTQIVPPWAELDGVHYFFASFDDERPIAFSHGFHVTQADGSTRAVGRIISQAGGCAEMKDAKDVVYSLIGAVGERREGDLIIVKGTIADVAPCGGSGVPFAVTGVTALPD